MWVGNNFWIIKREDIRKGKDCSPPHNGYKVNPQDRHAAIANAFKLINNIAGSDKWLNKYWQAKKGYRAYLAKNHYNDYIAPFENGSEYALPVDMFVYEGDMSDSSISDATNSVDYCIYLYDDKDAKYNMLFGSKEPKLFSWTK